MKNVAIIYHYLALYRLPVFQRMMVSDEVCYTLFSGTTSEINIEKISPEVADIPLSQGGLRWQFLENRWWFKRRLLWQSGLLKIVAFGNFESFVFLASPYFITTWLCAIIARFRGKKVYFWMHGVYGDETSILDFVKLNIFYRLSNGFFLYGNRAATIMASRNKRFLGRTNVVYNSLDYKKSLQHRQALTVQQMKSFRIKHFANSEVPIVSFIGRLNYKKRLDLLIKAQKLLKDRYRRDFFNLIIIGTGEELTSLTAMVKELDLSANVLFVGPVYDESQSAVFLSSSDLCVTPGEVGLTAIHSMSYGTPVISHDNLNLQMPEVEAIIHNSTGMLYKHLDLHDLTDVIAAWLNSHPSKTKTVIESCYEQIAKYYNPDSQVSVFDSVLK